MSDAQTIGSETALTPSDLKFGYEPGDVCWRNGCQGIIDEHPVENCSCHISPPCGACTAPRQFCPECGWEESEDDGVLNDYTVKYSDKSKGELASWKPRPLDPRKIDYRTTSHTHFTQIHEGVYPEGTTIEEVENLVRGTFGGRFDLFEKGKFRYVAYTD